MLTRKNNFMKFLMSYVAAILSAVQRLSSSEDYLLNMDSYTKEIKKIILNEEVSWNKGDAKAYSLNFAENGLFTNVFGASFMGYSAFLARHDKLFNGVFKGSIMKQEITSLEMIAKNVAIVETISQISEFSDNNHLAGIYIDENGFIKTRLLQVMRKEKKSWKIVAYHNVDIKKG
ncbi:SgcJ/EcaC family oxidoreductase [Chryseobacterium sp.]|uniref:SgcJ/EcaC family oxidoreductase n=1 Tax=Chryseobacterium sp. TaxID=1871047 RepID=UPI0031DAFECF